jgi:hypothetical protein
MSKPFLFLCLFVGTVSIYSQNQNIAQRLGYPADAKLLIIHADDLGVAHSQNRATFEQLKAGPVNSASIMVPCPWFAEVVTYAQNNQNLDLGLHLTLTSEWKHYKWASITAKDSVPSLLDDNGYFYPEVPEFMAHAITGEVEAEMRNQIKKAYRSGIDVTHLDAHMGAAVSTAEFTGAYMKLGKEFRLPVLLDARVFEMDHPVIKSSLDENTIILDHIFTILPQQFLKGSRSYYVDLLNNLPSGLNCLLIHLAFDDPEMQGITIDHPEWGAAWRQADFDFFNGPECAQLIKENNIILVTWRELRDKIVRSE